MPILEKTYTALNNVPFRVRIIEKGDGYGLHDMRGLSWYRLTHDDPVPMVEFYDARYPGHMDREHGQFVSRYNLDTLTARHNPAHGLDLQGDVPDWTIDAATLAAIMNDVIDQQIDAQEQPASMANANTQGFGDYAIVEKDGDGSNVLLRTDAALMSLDDNGNNQRGYILTIATTDEHAAAICAAINQSYFVELA